MSRSTNRPARSAPTRSRELAAEPPAPMPEPELLGATTGIDFSRRSAVDIELAANDRVAAQAAGEESLEEPPRWFLRVEDVAGTAPKAPMYDVYLNLPGEAAATDRPDLRAGSITSFGLPQASDPEAEHGGIGITQTFDVTDVITSSSRATTRRSTPRRSPSTSCRSASRARSRTAATCAPGASASTRADGDAAGAARGRRDAPLLATALADWRAFTWRSPDWWLGAASRRSRGWG